MKIKYSQKKLIAHVIIIYIIGFFVVHLSAIGTNPAMIVTEAADENVDKVVTQTLQFEQLSLESVENVITTQEPIEDETSTEESQYPPFTYSKDWSSYDSYLLAKIAMAEAEGESLQGKTLVIMVVLNRVQSDGFPDTIEDVIYQCSKSGVYQFSCIGDGRWDRVEPNQECYEAVWLVQQALYDYSEGALYFESCANEDNWHSRNLEFLYQEGAHRFYK